MPTLLGRFGKFTIASPLGTGGFGETYKAFLDGHSGAVVVKVLRGVQPSDDPDDQADAQRRFLREIEVLRHLRSEHIAGIIESGEIDGRAFVAIEFCGGGTLAEMMRLHPQGRSLVDAARIITDACQGVAAAHTKGVLHRDLNAGNVLLSDAGTWKLCDFGVARFTDRPSVLTGAGNLPGTAGFSAPERYDGKPDTITEAYDVYGLGCLLWFALTGRVPYAGPGVKDQLAIIGGHIKAPVPQLAPDHPAAALNPVLRRAMAKDPTQRYGSAAAMAADLQRVARLENRARQRDSSPTPAPTPAPGPAPEPTRRDFSGAHDALVAFERAVSNRPDLATHRDADRVREGLQAKRAISVYLGGTALVDWLLANSDRPNAVQVCLWVYHAFGVDQEIVRRLRTLGFELLDSADVRWPPAFQWDQGRTQPRARATERL